MAKRYYETHRHYESVVVFKPTLSDEELKGRLEDIGVFIDKNGGKVLSVEEWGIRQLAYPVKGFSHGRYVVFRISSDNSQLTNELDFQYKISEDIIRWLNFKQESKDVK
ncbi:MAG: 30S ribosomal protein S6 [Aquificaceae bacterium]|nr:30S ribosomal protein S6 [Aquificaceae bacterium]MDW8237387.1 30S ribosomal protein S6 [Aquificaceae bacterium]